MAKGLTLQDNLFVIDSENALKKMVKQKPAPLTLPKNVSLLKQETLKMTYRVKRGRLDY